MKIGLVLSGGGARGIVHIGVMKALTEMGIAFSVISGASAGAIIGAGHAAGISFDEMTKIFKSFRLFRKLKLSWGGGGIFLMDAIEEIFIKSFPQNSFEALKIPLYVSATSLSAGKAVYFNSGKLSKVLSASSCVPGLFRPVEINNELFVDGGVMDNLPVNILADLCPMIIASNCNPVSGPIRPYGIRKVTERSLLLALHVNTRQAMERCNVLIEPPQLTAYSALDFGKAEKLVEIGYRFVMEKFSPESFIKA